MLQHSKEQVTATAHQSRDQLIHENHFYYKNNTRGEDHQQKQQSGPFLAIGYILVTSL